MHSLKTMLHSQLYEDTCFRKKLFIVNTSTTSWNRVVLSNHVKN